MVVDVFKSVAAKPTYTTVLSGESFTTETDCAGRLELPPELWQTRFRAETLGPGRRTVVVNDIELNVTERAVIVIGTA